MRDIFLRTVVVILASAMFATAQNDPCNGPKDVYVNARQDYLGNPNAANELNAAKAKVNYCHCLERKYGKDMPPEVQKFCSRKDDFSPPPVTEHGPPHIDGLVNPEGPVGAPVTIYGSNFGAQQGTGTVKFNGITTVVTSWTNTQIMVTVPVGATTGNVVVNAGGASSNGVLFSVTKPTDAQKLGTKVQGGPYTVGIYVSNSNCSGTHTVQISFEGTPWMTIPGSNTVQVAPGEVKAVDAEINLTGLPPGQHTGTIRFKCTNCTNPQCAPSIETAQVEILVVPSVVKFGDSPSDNNFQGLVNGQPADWCTFMNNVVNEVANSSFGQTSRGLKIIKTLKDKYLKNNCARLKVVPTVATTSKSGTPFSKIQPVDDEEVIAGNARYTVAGYLNGGENLYVGVDLTQKSFYCARQNPSEFYAFTYGGQLAVVNRMDLITSLIHEGLHAVNGGNQNVATPDGKGRGSSIEEEKDAFNVENEVRQAFGVPQQAVDVNAKGYNAGSNPNYQPVQ